MKITIRISIYIISLLIITTCPTVASAQVMQTDANNSIPSRTQLLELKKRILDKLGFDSLSVKRSRKSCNCGCRIIHEEFPSLYHFQTLTIDDFCNSLVFTWRKDNCTGSELSTIRTLLNDTDINLIPEQITTKKQKRKYRIERYENDLPDAFIQLKTYKKGDCELILSLPYF